MATTVLIEGASVGVDLAEQSRLLGHEQMAHFLLDALALPITPEAILGGFEGEVCQLTQQPVIHSFDLAQMVGLKLGRMERNVEMTRQSLQIFESIADEAALAAGQTDIYRLGIFIEGALSACLEHSDGLMAGDAKVHLERLLNGTRFQLTGPMHLAEVPYSSH